MDRYTGASRPKENRPAAGGQVHGRFEPEKKTRLRPVGRYVGAHFLNLFICLFQEIGPESPANNRLKRIRELCEVVKVTRLEEVNIVYHNFRAGVSYKFIFYMLESD